MIYNQCIVFDPDMLDDLLKVSVCVFCGRGTYLGIRCGLEFAHETHDDLTHVLIVCVFCEKYTKTGKKVPVKEMWKLPK